MILSKGQLFVSGIFLVGVQFSNTYIQCIVGFFFWTAQNAFSHSLRKGPQTGHHRSFYFRSGGVGDPAGQHLGEARHRNLVFSTFGKLHKAGLETKLCRSRNAGSRGRPCRPLTEPRGI